MTANPAGHFEQRIEIVRISRDRIERFIDGQGIATDYPNTRRHLVTALRRLNLHQYGGAAMLATDIYDLLSYANIEIKADTIEEFAIGEYSFFRDSKRVPVNQKALSVKLAADELFQKSNFPRFQRLSNGSIRPIVTEFVNATLRADQQLNQQHRFVFKAFENLVLGFITSISSKDQTARKRIRSRIRDRVAECADSISNFVKKSNSATGRRQPLVS